jgi:hypothetical protein
MGINARASQPASRLQSHTERVKHSAERRLPGMLHQMPLRLEVVKRCPLSSMAALKPQHVDVVPSPNRGSWAVSNAHCIMSMCQHRRAVRAAALLAKQHVELAKIVFPFNAYVDIRGF